MKKGCKSPIKRSRIRWDEDNLQYNEENKSSTQKIDEPKTPYVPPLELEALEDGRMSPCALDSDMEMDGEEDHVGTSEETRKGKEAYETLPLVIPKPIEPIVEQPRVNEDQYTPPEGEASEWRRRSFEEHRKSHYNEYQMMKKAREQHLFDADELELEGGSLDGSDA